MEKVVRVAGALGFNQMRVRWKLIRWQESRRKAARQREQQIEHVRYQHKICPECGSVQDRDEAVCTACSAKLTSRRVQVLQRLGVVAPASGALSAVLAAALLAAYARTWLAAGGGFSSPSPTLLVALGGHWAPSTADEPWRLLTAVFLHGGLLHLVFNLLALATIGPVIEGLYGRLTMLGVFVVTGVLASLGSEVMGLAGVGIGASGGIMGLVGAAAGYGQRAGTGSGRDLRDRMLKWAAYTVILGFAVNADHWAHAFGFALGAVFGYAVRIEVWPRPALLAPRALLKLAGIAGVVAALALIFTRSVPPTAEPGAGDTSDAQPEELGTALDVTVEACRSFYTGDRDAAIAAWRSLTGSSSAADVTPDIVETMCDALYEARAQCERAARDGGGSAVILGSTCDSLARVLARLPDRPGRHQGSEAATGEPEQPGTGTAPSGPASTGSAAPAERAGSPAPAARSGSAAAAERAGSPAPAERSGSAAPAERTGSPTPAERSGSPAPATGR